MNREHMIEEAVFDISFSSEDEARRLGHDMDDFIQNKLLTFANEIFNELSTEGMVTRIDLLEIELGDILSSDFHQEILNRFKENIGPAIQKKLQIISLAPSDTECFIADQRTEFEQLKHFLETGVNQEGAGNNSNQSIDEMLEHVLREKGREFSEFLKSSSRQEIVLKRLSKQFAESVLIKVLELLVPAFAGSFPERLREFDEILEARTLKMDKTDAIRLFFERLLKSLLVGTNETREPERLFREVADTFFAAGYEEDSTSAQMQVKADVTPPPDHEASSPDAHLLAEDVLRIGLEHSLVTDDFSGVVREWVGLLQHPALRHLDAIERDALLWRYTLSWLRTSLEPQAERLAYVCRLIAGLERIGMGRGEILRAMRHGGSDVSWILDEDLNQVFGEQNSDHRWAGHLLRLDGRLSGAITDEMTKEIEALSTEHGKDLARLLEQWDARVWEHLSTGELRAFSRFMIEWKGQDKSKDFLREMERHVSEAANEANYYRYVLQKLLRNETIDLLEAQVSKPLNRKMDAERSSFDMGERLLRLLEGRLSGSVTDDMAQLIEALSAEHGKDLARLLEQCDARVWEHLSTGELRAFSRFMIEWKGQDKSKDFLRETERHVSKAVSEAGYYHYILQKLLKGEAVDLAEAVVSGAGKLPPPRNEHAVGSPSQMAMGAMDEIETDIFKHNEIVETTGEIQIANAGQVLMTPYLPRLFNMLELTEGGQFKSAGAAERAIHIIQYAVNGSQDSPEFQLSFNKVLCGIAMRMPITRCIDLLDSEKESIEGMLEAMIRHWSIIGNTSVQGLRESFLQRRGMLSFRDDAWRLRVESKGIDVLLDRLPWSYSVIKFPWMIQPVHVEWR